MRKTARRTERLGVLGGTFDPIHLGHLRLAVSVREAMVLDRILFVPARVPPHKARPSIASAEDRCRMIERAILDEPSFELSRVEIDREGPSYTIDTLAELASGRPDQEIYFIAGIDAFRDIRTWKRWKELLETYRFVVHERPGYPLASARGAVAREARVRWIELPPEGAREVDLGAAPPVVFLVQALTLDISGTGLRSLVRAGRSIRYLVPRAVEDYVVKRRLYKEED